MNNITLEYRYTVQGYITYSVNVKSGEFSGASGFCISKVLLKEAVQRLSKMYESLERYISNK